MARRCRPDSESLLQLSVLGACFSAAVSLGCGSGEMRYRWHRRAAFAILACCVAAAQMDVPKEPLCRAAFDGDVARVRSLLEAGAKPNVRDEENETPLMRAALAHARSTLDFDPKAPHDPEAVVRLLLDHSANVNARGPKGRTALLQAMEGSASEYRVVGAEGAIARLLIERGADVNAQDDDGWSPLLALVNL